MQICAIKQNAFQEAFQIGRSVGNVLLLLERTSLKGSVSK